MGRKVLNVLGLLLLFFVTFIIAMEINFLWLFGKMPSLEEARNPKLAVPSKIYSADGEILGIFYTENRIPVKKDEIDSTVVDALIATEDVRFYEHHGLDLRSFSGAILSTITGDKRGGSTINQQLVKNVYNTRRKESLGLLGYVPVIRTIIAKLKEWDVAVKMDYFFEKDEILMLYLNAVDFGGSTYGIKLASKHLFSKDPKDLKLHESALLIGILKGTNYYNPERRPERAMARRNIVLDQMLVYDKITKEQHAEAIKMPLDLKITEITKEHSKAPYFRTMLRPIIDKIVTDRGYNLYADGLKIYTTIDSRMQQMAEKAVEEHLTDLQKMFFQEQGNYKYWFDRQKLREQAEYRKDHPKEKQLPQMPSEKLLETQIKRLPEYQALKKAGMGHEAILTKLSVPHKTILAIHKGTAEATISTIDSLKYMSMFLQAGLLSVDPHNMYVKAWVGGSNFDYFKFDHVGLSKRQVGSSFKPFIYAAALEKGYDKCTTFVDKPFSIKTIINGKQAMWEPKNSGDKFTYWRLNMRQAIGKSVNSIAIYMLQSIGVGNAIDMAKKLGISSKLDRNLSLALGTSDISLREMTKAYVPFSNLGKGGKLVFFTRIENKVGDIIYAQNTKMTQLLTEYQAYEMSWILRGSVEEGGGTSRALVGYGICDQNEVGGKTGTTNDYRDGWFMGITPNLVTGVWVGCEDHRIHFNNANGQGGRAALPIFGRYMKSVYANPKIGIKRAKFPKPKDYKESLWCSYKGTGGNSSGGLDSLSYDSLSPVSPRIRLDIDTISTTIPRQL